MNGFIKRVIRGDATRKESQDTGMAIVLALLLLAFARRQQVFVLAAIVAQVVTMTAPQVFKHVAVLWFGLSHALGTVASRVLLTVAYAAVVVPIGWARRMMGSDPLRLRAFKKARGSVMDSRHHLFTAKDLEQPY